MGDAEYHAQLYLNYPLINLEHFCGDAIPYFNTTLFSSLFPPSFQASNFCFNMCDIVQNKNK